eukprot:2250959-Rhodomonas_salina.1
MRMSGIDCAASGTKCAVLTETNSASSTKCAVLTGIMLLAVPGKGRQDGVRLWPGLYCYLRPIRPYSDPRIQPA